MEWKEKIYNHEVPPPEHLWNRVIHDLDNGDLVVFKQKLFHTEEQPPETAWDNICRDLEHGDLVVFKQKLFDAQEPVPYNAWGNIQQMLHEPKIVPLRKKNGLLFRALAAAAFIGVMFVAVNQLIFKEDVPENVTSEKNTSLPQKEEQKSVATESPAGQPENNPGTPRYTIASNQVIGKGSNKTTESDHLYAYEPFSRNPSPISIENKSFTDRMDMTGGLSRKIRNLKGEVREDVSLLDLPNSYFMMTGPNGQSMRVSSKFRNTIQYLNAEGKEELLDVILRESQYWKSIFKDWKTKVGNSSFVPTADNFMDIAELMELIQESQEKK